MLLAAETMVANQLAASTAGQASQWHPRAFATGLSPASLIQHDPSPKRQIFQDAPSPHPTAGEGAVARGAASRQSAFAGSSVPSDELGVGSNARVHGETAAN